MGIHQPPKSEWSFPLDVHAHGSIVLFRPDRRNLCPDCGNSQWHVGRISAECGICGAALPLASEIQHSRLARAAHRALEQRSPSPEGAQADTGERRGAVRILARGRTLCLHVDGATHSFRLENISEGGAMGRSVPGLRMARSLVVEFEDGRKVPAQLRWCDGEFAGLAFRTANED